MQSLSNTKLLREIDKTPIVHFIQQSPRTREWNIFATMYGRDRLYANHTQTNRKASKIY